MAQDKHKYRVSIYLGKDNYNMLKEYAEVLALPLSTLCRVIFETGIEISKTIEKGDKPNGSK